MTSAAKSPLSHRGPYRVPAEETVDLYSGLVVHDGRQSGSITIGRSRLPLWSIIRTAILCDWDEVERGWSPGEHYGYTDRDLADFLGDLMELRGEFGRLLLILAAAERYEREVIDARDELLPWVSWWESPEVVDRVRLQLLRCLAELDMPGSDIHVHLYEHGNTSEQAAVLRRLADVLDTRTAER